MADSFVLIFHIGIREEETFIAMIAPKSTFFVSHWREMKLLLQ